MLEMQKKMEQETKMSPHVWIYLDRNSKRTMMMVGGEECGVEGGDETRDRLVGRVGTKYREVEGLVGCLCCP